MKYILTGFNISSYLKEIKVSHSISMKEKCGSWKWYSDKET